MELKKFQRRPALAEQRFLKCVVERSFHTISKEKPMDKDRIEGSFEQAKGKIKEVAGKATGDSKLETEGKAQKTAGKVQNTVGGIKDTIKESTE